MKQTSLRIAAKLLWTLLLMGVLIVMSAARLDFVYRAF